MKTTNKLLPQVMAFYHKDGLPAAWLQAAKFAGKGGHMATMPHIIAARLETKPDDVPWSMYFTTATAEYFGRSKQGNPILIVAHGVGPMATLGGVCKAYSWEYRDKDRRRNGGRITEQEFWDLEAGKFGEVSIVDIAAYCARYEYPFIQVLRSSEALTDPVIRARFGPEAERDVLAHTEHARAWHREHGAENPDPFIIRLDGAANCSYGNLKHGFRKIEEGYALGHLVSTGSLVNLHHEGGESLTNDTSCHEWWNGVRLVAIQEGGNIRSGLHQGFDAYNTLRKHWHELLIPMKEPGDVGFRGLVQIGDQWFTQYPKEGERMDTWEPEYVVTTIKKVGDPVQFRTTVGGYEGFFKFGVNEVQAIAPLNANAYHFVCEPQIEWHNGKPTHHTCMVDFYQITADTTNRMMRLDSFVYDYDTLMKLVAKEIAA